MAIAEASSTTATVTGLWRYPVKSMQGEGLNAAEVTERGAVGDRAYALLDRETGKVASTKNPRKWARLFDYRAAFVEPPRAGAPLPPRGRPRPHDRDARPASHPRQWHPSHRSEVP